MCLQERDYLPKLSPRLCEPDYKHPIISKLLCMLTEEQFKEYKDWFHAQYDGWEVARYNTIVHEAYYIEITRVIR